MIRSVVLRFGRGGMIGGTMLGLGRAMGETIAVLMIFQIQPEILRSGANAVAAFLFVACFTFWRGREALVHLNFVTQDMQLAGLFILASVILTLGAPKSGLAAGLAISVMMLPIIRAAEVVIRLVPGSLREASFAVGAPRWRTAWHGVLPAADATPGSSPNTGWLAKCWPLSRCWLCPS